MVEKYNPIRTNGATISFIQKAEIFKEVAQKHIFEPEGKLIASMQGELESLRKELNELVKLCDERRSLIESNNNIY